MSSIRLRKMKRRGAWEYSHAERLQAAAISLRYREIWGLGKYEMGRQCGATADMIEDIEGGRYPKGAKQVITRLLFKNIHKKPHKV